MILFWSGIFFLSSSGMFLFPVYAEQNRGLWPFILGTGIVLNIIGCYRFPDFKLHRSVNKTPDSGAAHSGYFSRHNLLFSLFMIPVILGIYTFQFPYNIPLFVVGTGIILSYALNGKYIRPIASGILFSGVILVLQTAFTIPYFKFAARCHEINFLSPFFYLILKAIGIPCSVSQDTIFVQTTQANLAMVPSSEKLGLFVFVMFAVGTITLLYLVWENRSKTGFWKNTGILFSVIISYLIVRYVFLSVIFVEISNAEIFWRPLIVTVSFLPLPFILWAFLNSAKVSASISCQKPLSNLEQKSTDSSSTSGTGWIGIELFPAIAMFLFSFAMVSCFWFQDPGELKKGRVLIDEHYSNWEWTDKTFNTEWFGIQSVYNYYCFADYLNHFYTVERLKEGITEQKLSQCDVLIIKPPTLPFTTKELDDIEQFVTNGGGLFIIGDHTNVFGTTININPLADRFGFWFNYDATYDLIDSDLHFHKQNRIFIHPAIQHMPYFLYATSCSLYAPFFAEDTMIASNLKTMYLDYGRGGYFPEKNKVLNYTFGPFVQSSGVKYGKGRVMAFADSTCFSNFYMHIPGKPEFALGTIDWLNRSNLYNSQVKLISIIVMVVSISFLIYFFLITGKKLYLNKEHYKTKSFYSLNGVVSLWPSKIVRCLLFGGLLGTSSGTLLFNSLGEQHYPLPREHTSMVKIGFEEDFCNFHIPSVTLLHNPIVDFQTFYVWPQRLGYVPDLFSFKDSFDDFDMVVMVHPREYFTEEDLNRIDSYVSNGGKLLLVDYPKGLKSTANQVAEHFGMKIDYKQYQEKVDIYDGTEKIGVIKGLSPVKGGEKVLETKDRETFVSTLEHGKGLIAVMACSTSFTNEDMGNTEAIPDEHQQFLYKLEFWLFSSLINGRFEPYSDFSIE